MSLRGFRRPVLLSAGLVCILASFAVWMKYGPAPRATATQQAQSPTNATPSIPSPVDASDYSKRVVAYIYDSIPITRRDLGEYLIERYGAQNVEKMVRQYLIEVAAAKVGVFVTPAEIDAEMNETMSMSKLTRQQFNQIITTKYGSSVPEWKEDVVKTRLLLTKICRDSVSVSEEELRLGFESTCGDKIRARVIMWPLEDRDEAVKQLALIQHNDQEFDRCAKQQKDENLAAKGGEMELYHNFAKNPQTEAAAFALKNGEVSKLIATADGWMVIKCVEHLPATTGIKYEDVREAMHREAINRKLKNVAIPALMADLKERANVRVLLKKGEEKPTNVPEGTDIANLPVAMIYENTPVTRAQLGEWLIGRYGVKEIEKVVYLKVVDSAAEKNQINLTKSDIDAEVTRVLSEMHLSLEQLEKTVLKPQGSNADAWRQEQITQLKLVRLCKDRVKVSEEDIKKAYDAHYGEKIQARIIMWPAKEQHIAVAVYPKIRDSEEEFDRAARSQSTSMLSARGGEVDPFGRYSTGNEEMEKIAFRLKPGEVSHLIQTPDGFVVVKCMKRIPPQTEVKLNDVRAKLQEECWTKKLHQVEIPLLVKELHTQAHPRIFLKKDTSEEPKVEDRKQVAEAKPASGR